MKNDLEDYFIAQKALIEEIKADKLTCLEAQDRCISLWRLVPPNVILDSFTLNSLMKEKYGNSPDWNYGVIITI